MPNANWSNPTLASTYTNFVSEVKNRDEDLALQFDGTTATNLPTGAIRWDSTANRWRKWSGTAWVELTATYALTGLSTTGNASIGGTLTVTGDVSIASTGAIDVPAGTTAQRPGTPSSGMIRFNSTLSQFEGYSGTGWGTIGGGAKGAGTDQIFYENGQTVTANYTVGATTNAMSAGPITINSGVTVTINSGGNWVVV